MHKPKRAKSERTYLPIGKDFRIIARYFRLANSICPSCTWILIITAVFESAIPFISIFVPKLVIEELMGAKRVDYLIVLVLSVAVIDALFTWIVSRLRRQLEGTCLELQEKFKLYLSNRIMYRDYEDLEDPVLLDTKNKAVMPLLMGGVWTFYQSITYLVSGILTMIALTALISTLNFFIILLIVIMVIINAFIYKRSRAIQYDIEKKESVLSREVDYYDNLTSDFAAGKDIRLYNFQSLIIDKIKNLHHKTRNLFETGYRKSSKLDGTSRANAQAQMVLVYAYLTYMVFTGLLSIANFTMYINAAVTFSNTLTRFFDWLIMALQVIQKAEPFLDFVDIHPKKSNEGNTTEGIRQCDIEFRHVSFRYPRSENYVLKDVSIHIPVGEKLSIVGLNGAGKTTFVKLLTRLYDPDKGEILLNGVNIQEYGYQEYQRLLAVVFQDFQILSMTIRENIALEFSEQTPDEKIWSVLELAGLKETVEKLPNKLDTCLYKVFDDDGIEFSGGQNQKLAIARAMFKDAPIVILDEPTAALDPYSEYEIYSHIDRLMGNKTAIYISHRLSSCRFCDRIILFENGTIVQDGTHEELMAQSGSTYEKMYSTQAGYYV